MGSIVISFNGSFGARSQVFTAQDHGHAAAIAKAISFLATVPMQDAIVNDHRCHADGLEPSEGFAGVAGLVKKTEPA